MGKASLGAVLAAILVGGLIAGALDFTAACIIYKSSPEIVGKAVAAGVLGPASFQGPVSNAYLGAALHFGISWGAAAIYVLSSLAFPILRSRAAIGGIVFGLCVFMVMNFFVVPNSLAARPGPFNWPRKLPDLAAHMALFGPAIALSARQFLRG